MSVRALQTESAHLGPEAMRVELANLPACEPDGRHWFWHGEQILTLLEQHQPHVCVELGTYKGGSAIATARLIRQWGGHLVCIDLWDGAVSVDECVENIRRAGVMDNVTVVRKDSHLAAQHWRHSEWSLPIDYLYVDADHSTDGCFRDLELWWPNLRAGGLIAGDDYDDPRWGVTAAWDRFEREYQQDFKRQATPGSDPACTRLIWGVKR